MVSEHKSWLHYSNFYVTSMDLYKVMIEMSLDCYFALNKKKMLFVGHLIW